MNRGLCRQPRSRIDVRLPTVVAVVVLALLVPAGARSQSSIEIFGQPAFCDGEPSAPVGNVYVLPPEVSCVINFQIMWPEGMVAAHLEGSSDRGTSWIDQEFAFPPAPGLVSGVAFGPCSYPAFQSGRWLFRVHGLDSADGSLHSSPFPYEVQCGTQGDLTPPLISVPPGLIIDASSPLGEVVVYVVTVTDDADPAPSLDCEPSSGSMFAIGKTTVECASTDASGNTAHASFSVHVQGAAEQVADLIVVVDEYQLQMLGSSLNDKLVTVERFLAAGKPRQAEDNMRSFVNQVETQRGKGLTQDQADVLSHTGQRIIDVIDA